MVASTVAAATGGSRGSGTGGRRGNARGRGRGNRGNDRPKRSKEDLDQEMEDYQASGVA